LDAVTQSRLPDAPPIRYLLAMRLFVLFLAAHGLLCAAQAPTPATITVPPQEALSHRIGHDRPAYPHFAIAAGVAGVVKIPVMIDADGSIESKGDATGPPALISAAQAWVSSSKFRPFMRDGQAVAVSATLPVAFQLPASAHSAHPAPAIYEHDVTTMEREGRDGPPRVRLQTLLPAMQAWLARYEAAEAENAPPGPNRNLDEILAQESAAKQLPRMPDDLTVYPIPFAARGHRLYLLFEFSSRCKKTNCSLAMVEESPAGVRALVAASGVDVDLHKRTGSPYPDLLAWSDTAQSGISNIAGYSSYGGEWGQLYCGTDDANEDSERDEAAALHHAVGGPRHPLVTLCK
jgi:Gram-negative bacterial TonB protein C-terminal